MLNEAGYSFQCALGRKKIMKTVIFVICVIINVYITFCQYISVRLKHLYLRAKMCDIQSTKLTIDKNKEKNKGWMK